MKTILFDDKGSALLISLCLLGMLTLLAIMAVNTSNTDIDLSFNQINADKALYIAEAGAKHAFIELNNDNGWRTGFSNLTFDDGTYSVSASTN
jgi:Tfp pilus assembly protein PilX